SGSYPSGVHPGLHAGQEAPALPSRRRIDVLWITWAALWVPRFLWPGETWFLVWHCLVSLAILARTVRRAYRRLTAGRHDAGRIDGRDVWRPHDLGPAMPAACGFLPVARDRKRCWRRPCSSASRPGVDRYGRGLADGHGQEAR